MKVKLVLPALIEAAAPGYSAQFATPVSPLDRKRRPMFPPLGLAQLAAFLPKARYSSTRDRSLAQVPLPSVRAEQITAEGFTIVVETWLHTLVWSVDLSWLAIGV